MFSGLKDEGLLPLGYGVNKSVGSVARFLDMEAEANRVFNKDNSLNNIGQNSHFITKGSQSIRL